MMCNGQVFSSQHTQYHRCYGDLFASKDSMVTLLKSSCQKLSKGSQGGGSKGHILVVLPPWMQPMEENVLHPMLSLASSLKGYNVSVMEVTSPTCGYGFAEGDMYDLMQLSAIKPNPFLEIIPVQIDDTHSNSKIDWCLQDFVHPFRALDRVQAMAKAFDDALEKIKYPINMVVLDSTNVGSALKAQQYNIPYTMLSHPTEHQYIFPQKWMGIVDFISRRINQIKWGYYLRRLNTFRRKLSLSWITKPVDFYQQPAAVLLHPDYSRGALSKGHIHNVRPMTTECVTCNPNHSSGNNVTVLVVPLQVGLLEMRAVIRGIAIAKASLQAQADLICEPNESDDCRLYKFFSKLKAVVLMRLNETSHLPRLLPNFVDVETSHPIDSLARHPFTFAVISHCDTSTHVAAAMGVSIICLPRLNQTSESAQFNAKYLGSFAEARGNDIASSLISVLVDGRVRKNRTIYSMTHGSGTITSVTSQMMIANMTGVSLDEIRKKTSPTENDEDNWLLRSALTITLCICITGIIYGHAFCDHVKLPTQLPAWRRRFRIVTQYTSDIDPSLLRFQKWMTDEKSLHNQLFPTTKSPQTAASPEIGGAGGGNISNGGPSSQHQQQKEQQHRNGVRRRGRNKGR